MATIDRTRQALTITGASTDSCELPRLLIDELFAPRRIWVESNGNFQRDSAWMRATFSVPSRSRVFDERPEETLLRSDEVTREALSFSSRPVVIEVSDDQAEQFLRFQRRGAPSPE